MSKHDFQARSVKRLLSLQLKRAFNPIFENRRKNLEKLVYLHEPIAIRATHQIKKV